MAHQEAPVRFAQAMKLVLAIRDEFFNEGAADGAIGFRIDEQVMTAAAIRIEYDVYELRVVYRCPCVRRMLNRPMIAPEAGNLVNDRILAVGMVSEGFRQTDTGS